MLRSILTILIILFGVCPIAVGQEQTPVLSAGISLNSQVPSELMGTWRVVSKIIETDSPENFKNVGVVIWNLFRSGDVISLCNPFTGAEASVNVEYIKDNTVRFSKEGNYEGKKLIDTVEITIDNNTFSGKNYVTLESDTGNLDNRVRSATYALSGRKISGNSVLE